MTVSRRTVAVSKEAARCLETVAADLGAQRTAPGTIERKGHGHVVWLLVLLFGGTLETTD